MSIFSKEEMGPFRKKKDYHSCCFIFYYFFAGNWHVWMTVKKKKSNDVRTDDEKSLVLTGNIDQIQQLLCCCHPSPWFVRAAPTSRKLRTTQKNSSKPLHWAKGWLGSWGKQEEGLIVPAVVRRQTPEVLVKTGCMGIRTTICLYQQSIAAGSEVSILGNDKRYWGDTKPSWVNKETAWRWLRWQNNSSKEVTPFRFPWSLLSLSFSQFVLSCVAGWTQTQR